MTKATINADITHFEKVGDEGLIYAWASIIEEDGKPVVDSQGDVIAPAEMQKAFHRFMTESREVGHMHTKITGIGKVVEGMVFTKEVQEALGIDLGKVGAFVVMKVDPTGDVFAGVKSGKYKALSIGGRGKRAAME